MRHVTLGNAGQHPPLDAAGSRVASRGCIPRPTSVPSGTGTLVPARILLPPACDYRSPVLHDKCCRLRPDLSAPRFRPSPGVGRPEGKAIHEYQSACTLDRGIAHPQSQRASPTPSGKRGSGHPPGDRRAEEQGTHQRDSPVCRQVDRGRHQVYARRRDPLAQEGHYSLHGGKLRSPRRTGECHRFRRSETVLVQSSIYPAQPSGRSHPPRALLGQLPRNDQDGLWPPGHRSIGGRTIHSADGRHRARREFLHAGHHRQQSE